MKRHVAVNSISRLTLLLLVLAFPAHGEAATDKLTGFYSARTMSQAMPWIAEEAGLFRKYDLEFQLVYISSSPMVTAALLGGDAQIAISGGEAIVRAHAQGASDLVLIASAKNTLTHSILAKPEIKRPEDLKGKKLGISRLGSNSHYFVIQALRKNGMEPTDVTFIQTGGQVENLAALALPVDPAAAQREKNLAPSKSYANCADERSLSANADARYRSGLKHKLPK